MSASTYRERIQLPIERELEHSADLEGHDELHEAVNHLERAHESV